MKTLFAAAGALLVGSVSFTAPAHAIGCASGAAVGAVAGHVAGRHGVLGAAAGCAVGHHENAKQQKNTAAAASQPSTQQ